MINGNIYARVQYTDESTGKRKEKLRRAKSRREARELIKQMRSELQDRGEAGLTSDKLLFSELAARYSKVHLVYAVFQNGIKVAGKKSLGPSKSSLKPVLLRFGRKAVRTIRPSDIEEYKIARLNTPVQMEVNQKEIDPQSGQKRIIKVLIERPRKIASVNRELELIRAIFNFAKGEGLISKGPFDARSKLIASSAENARDRVMSFAEEGRLLAACSERRIHLRALIIMAVDTGMRRGELFKLRWNDVNLNAATVIVRAENAKTEKSRVIGLSQRLLGELSQLWERSPKDGRGSVFGLSSTVKNGWKSACADAGIEGLRFHDLRHTATTRMTTAPHYMAGCSLISSVDSSFLHTPTCCPA